MLVLSIPAVISFIFILKSYIFFHSEIHVLFKILVSLDDFYKYALPKYMWRTCILNMSYLIT